MVATHPAEQQAVPLLKNFYLTFGVQYRHEPHPYWKGADPDGWVLIQATDYDAARRQAVRHFGQRWSMLYEAAYFNEEENKARYYPKGAIAEIISDGQTLTYWHPEGTPAPSIHITPADPEYYGKDPRDVVAARIEGHLYKNPSEMYDVVLVHRDCREEAQNLFKVITEEDDRVRAFEIDWSQPANFTCDVCKVPIT